MEMRIRREGMTRSEWKRTAAALAGMIGGGAMAAAFVIAFGGGLPVPDIVGIPLTIAVFCLPIVLGALAYTKSFRQEQFNEDGKHPRIRLDQAAGVIGLPTDNGEAQLPIAGAHAHVGWSSEVRVVPMMPGETRSRTITVRIEHLRISGAVGTFHFTHAEGGTSKGLVERDSWPPEINPTNPTRAKVYQREFWPFIEALRHAGVPVHGAN